MAAVPPAASAANLRPSRPLFGGLARYWPLLLVVGTAIFFRLYGLGRVPALIGDEAWYGVQAQRLLAGTSGELRTPTGNVPGMIQMGSLALLHSLFEPSTALLRIPALFSSLAAMAVAYAVGSRFFGQATGIAALVLMAVLPINIAYARFGWDPSHAPLLILIATYATLAGRRLLAALVFALALSNHPAAVFIAPFLTLAYLGLELGKAEWRNALVAAAGLAAMLGLAILLSLWLSPGASHYLSLSKSIARLTDLDQWVAFGAGFCRLLSGETIYTFVVGSGFGPSRWWVDATIAILLASVIFGALWQLGRGRDWRLAGVLAGWLASLLLLFIIAGPWVVLPQFERFSLPIVVPTVILVAVVFGRLFGETRTPPTLQAVLVVLAVPLLAGFWAFYVQPLDRNASDLNLQAAERVAAEAGSNRVDVVAEDFWIYWPVAYRLAGKPVAMVDASAEPAKALGSHPIGSYWIGYRDGALQQQLAVRPDIQLRAVLEAPDGKKSLIIWRNDGPR